MKVARVKVKGNKDLVLVPITSPEKPPISKDIEEKWQTLVDLMAKVLGVPSGLIMRLDEFSIEVFMKSRQKENPYHEHEKADLSTGLYCETVVGKRNSLLVPDAREDPEWEDNPDVELNMISYLGFPKGFNPEQKDTLGFQIIRSLTQEMEGDFSVVGEGGVRYDFSFRLPDSPDN